MSHLRDQWPPSLPLHEVRWEGARKQEEQIRLARHDGTRQEYSGEFDRKFRPMSLEAPSIRFSQPRVLNIAEVYLVGKLPTETYMSLIWRYYARRRDLHAFGSGRQLRHNFEF